MNDHFSLSPFPSVSPLPNLQLTGNITRHFNTLAICYTLLGDLAELVIPTSTDIPTRKNELWAETCFEFFLTVKNLPQYWEFNLSPTGHWNIYRFAAYRQGMQEEMAFTSLPFIVENQAEVLRLNLELDLSKLVRADYSLAVGISAVVKLRNGEVTYWALTHRGPQADFHRRDSFIVEL